MQTVERTPDRLVITRVLNAPLDRVWRAWSEREQLMQWWGQPANATMPRCTLDFRVGGGIHYRVEQPDGTAIWGKATYREIVDREKIVFDDCFADEDGNEVVTDELPRMTVEARFEERDGRTVLTVTHEGIAAGSATVEQYEQGWTESLDRMEAAAS